MRDFQDVYYEHTITELRRELEELKKAARGVCDGFSQRALIQRRCGNQQENSDSFVALGHLVEMSGWKRPRDRSNDVACAAARETPS